MLRQNQKELDAYQKAIRDRGLAVFRGILLTDDDVMRRDIITRLMCHFILYKSEVEEAYGLDFDAVFADALDGLRPLEADGLVALHPDRIEVSPLGRLMVRNIAMFFDAYLKKDDGAKRFSRTV